MFRRAADALHRSRGTHEADSVLPARPRPAVLGSIRCAEELAVLDHLTKGRIYAGFARGYQDRWVNVLGQQYHVTGAPMDGSSIDNHNRSVYEETLKVIKKAWTEESFEYDGEYYNVPYPYSEGITR